MGFGTGQDTYREGYLLVLPEVVRRDGGQKAPVGGGGGDGAPHGNTQRRGRALDDHEAASGSRSSVGGGVRRSVMPRSLGKGGRRRCRSMGGGEGEARGLERADGLQHLSAVVVVDGDGAGAGGPGGSGVDGGPERGGVEVAVVHGGGREAAAPRSCCAVCRRGIAEMCGDLKSERGERG